MIHSRTTNRLVFAAIAGAVAAVVALGSASPAAAELAELRTPTSTPPGHGSVVDFYNKWMFCEDAWLVSLDQMYPEGFSVLECMHVIDVNTRP